MKIIIIYFLIGAIVSIWTAINQMEYQAEQNSASQLDSVERASYLAAYILIALAWPVSVIVSVYSLIQILFADNSQ